MRKTLALAGLCLALLASSCDKNQDFAAPQGETVAGLPALPQEHVPVDANGLITVATLTSDKVWLIDGVSYVKPGQTLTIQPGTYLTTGTIKQYNDPAFGLQNVAGVLVVPKTAKLIANGTATAPIVFTSPKAAGQRAAGNFGGIVILGQSTTNKPTSTRIEGIPQPAGTDITYGGSIAADNSGSLKYVRIEFPGYKLDDDNEINGLTLGGVGSGTVLSHIQVSWSADDAFEFFGGRVNADHLVALSTDDDDFDFDFGYTGTIQYAISLKDVNSTNSGTVGNSDSNGLESDNDGTGSSATPATKPVLRNFTFLGVGTSATASSKLKFGNRWRRATSLDIQNSIIGGYTTGVSFESVNTAGTFSNNVVHGYTTTVTGTAPTNYAGNSVGVNASANAFLRLAANPFYPGSSLNVLNLRPLSTSPAYGNGTTTYKGAIAPNATAATVWTANWTQFNPKNY
ncbi:MAG TPA: hypothetical protein VN040_14285 [Pseudosphingobacterium sp.]|nr:hypothetical protein [Pseudosphingobacterium sp.]